MFKNMSSCHPYAININKQKEKRKAIKKGGGAGSTPHTL
jgi:hypothetical protein